MSQIEGQVYLGSVVYSKDQYWLKKTGIRRVLVVGDLPQLYPKLVSYKVIKIQDKETENIAQYFEECHQYID